MIDNRIVRYNRTAADSPITQNAHTRSISLSSSLSLPGLPDLALPGLPNPSLTVLPDSFLLGLQSWFVSLVCVLGL